MTLENIWVIDSNSGICIYDWCVEGKIKTIDEQLVSGLLLAFKNFSSEAGLVDISAIEGIDRKLAYKADERFIIAGICHSKDNEGLINKTLLDILKGFRKKYKKLLDEGATTDVSPFRTFDENILEALEGKQSTRNALSLLVGSILTLCCVGIVFAIYYFTYNPLIVAFGEPSIFVGLIILLLGFLLSGLVGGVIAGERRFGIIANFIAIVPIMGLFIGFFHQFWGSITEQIFRSSLYVILFAAMAVCGGLIGGYIKERRFFYPISIDPNQFIIEETTIDE
ncbi:MAG: hypothetical protein FK734_16185 [Asgard group archaeon]|nr:hypothetical protein [Asgard group archaeon]